MTAKIDGFGLAGRVCVVTGGGSGIGRAIAANLAAEGAKVAILDRNLAGAQETLNLVSGAGAEGLALACDISDPGSVEAAHAAVTKRFGDAHVLVNNAAIRFSSPIENVSLADWNALIAVNLTGYLICSQQFGRPMLAKGDGAVVHISSIVAIHPNTFNGIYSVTKAGVTMLSRILAVEWGPKGVRSNAVLPGMTVTPLTQSIYDRPGVMEQRSAMVPSRRPATPDDIAQAVLFLASPRSSYVNGQELAVDGAFTRNLMAFVPKADFNSK